MPETTKKPNMGVGVWQKGETTKGHEKTLWDDEYIYYFTLIVVMVSRMYIHYLCQNLTNGVFSVQIILNQLYLNKSVTHTQCNTTTHTE